MQFTRLGPPSARDFLRSVPAREVANRLTVGREERVRDRVNLPRWSPSGSSDALKGPKPDRLLTFSA